MTVRAKMYVAEITHYASDSTRVVLQAVSRGTENKTWSAATPAGRIEMTIKNPLAIKEYQIGKEYYVDFTPAEPPPAPGDGHEPEPYDPGYGSVICATCGNYAGKGADGEPDWSQHQEVYSKRS